LECGGWTPLWLFWIVGWRGTLASLPPRHTAKRSKAVSSRRTPKSHRSVQKTFGILPGEKTGSKKNASAGASSPRPPDSPFPACESVISPERNFFEGGGKDKVWKAPVRQTWEGKLKVSLNNSFPIKVCYTPDT
jgi:hypothetical protein